MTYSHNSVSNNIKMTTAAAATATIRLKNVSKGDGGGFHNLTSPPVTPPLTAHSNSIATSTNYHALSTSPPGCSMSSGASTSSNCSASSLGSNSVESGGFFAVRQRQQQQQRNWQQRNSPQHFQQVGGSYFSNNHHHYYQNHNNHHGKRNGINGSAQKQRDSQRSPNTAQVRQSPAVILGGGANNSNNNNQNNSISGGSCRKNRAKLAGNNSPLLGNVSGGKTSPSQPLIPTALTHYAGSKCFDAPAPTALPKPPEHWTLSKTEQKAASSAGPGLRSVTAARSLGQAVDAHTFGGHVVKTSKRNLLDDFDTHNLKLLLNVQS